MGRGLSGGRAQVPVEIARHRHAHGAAEPGGRREIRASSHGHGQVVVDRVTSRDACRRDGRRANGLGELRRRIEGQRRGRQWSRHTQAQAGWVDVRRCRPILVGHIGQFARVAVDLAAHDIDEGRRRIPRPALLGPLVDRLRVRRDCAQRDGRAGPQQRAKLRRGSQQVLRGLRCVVRQGPWRHTGSLAAEGVDLDDGHGVPFTSARARSYWA